MLKPGAEGVCGVLMDNKEEKAAVRVIPLPLQPVEPASRSSGCIKEVNGHM